jgi:hypothetical protein
MACSVWPISPSASAARYASTISPACQHAPRRRGPLYPNLGGGAGSADHADRPVCSLHTIDELPQLINVLRGDMSIVLVRQTGAVGAIRDRAPFGTSRASVGGEPGCGPYLIVHSPDLVASTPQFWQRDCRSRFTDLTAADPRWRRGARRRARGPIARLTRP